MKSVALVQTSDRNVNQLQQNINQALRPLLLNPALNGIILTEVALASGVNTISHTLDRPLQGWIPVRVRASATFYDLQDSNENPSTTLILNSSAAVVVDLYVF